MLTTLVLLMMATPGPGKMASQPPTDADILRALPGVARGVPFVFEQFRDDITIVKHQIRKPKVVAVLDYPILGRVALATDSWECAVYYTETIKRKGIETSKKRMNVVYIDTESLVPAK